MYTVENYMAEIRKQVSYIVVAKMQLTVEELDNFLWYESTEYELALANAKRYADDDGVIRSNNIENMILEASEAIVAEIHK